MVRWPIVSGSPTVGGFGGYLSAGMSTSATKALGGHLGHPLELVAPAMRWCSAATTTPSTTPSRDAVDDRGGHATPVLGAAAELGGLTGRQAEAGGVLEARARRRSASR